MLYTTAALDVRIFKGLGEEVWLPISIRFVFLSFTMTFDTLMGEKKYVQGRFEGVEREYQPPVFQFSHPQLKISCSL